METAFQNHSFSTIIVNVIAWKSLEQFSHQQKNKMEFINSFTWETFLYY